MIVFFLPDLRGGGAERVMLNLLESYDEVFPGQAVLLVGRKQGKLISQIPPQINVYELNASSATKSVIPFIKFCKKHQPEKVFASLGSSLATALARPFISKKIKIINRLGNTIGAEKKLLSSAVKKRLYIAANQIIAKSSDKIIFQCHYMAKDFIKETGITPRAFKVIYNPVNTDRIKQLSEQPVPIDFDFVSVGRLSAQKDYETLIDAFGILKNQHQISYTIRILGEGELKEKLENQIHHLGLSENVIISGFSENPYPFIKNAKAIISSSLYEGFSNVIVESLSLGTPVIASDCPGANKEVIFEGQNGLIFQTSNPNDLAEILQQKLNDVLEMNKNLIAVDSEGKYNIHTIFNQYLEFINE